MSSADSTDAVKLDRLQVLDLPVTVDRYTLTGLLGEGGMARVFRAEMQGAMGFLKPAAFKVLLPGESGDSEPRRRALFQEARVGGLLAHPNIAQVFDCGVHGGLPYIAMELVDGLSFQELVESFGPLPMATVLDVAAQTCRGLHHAHTAEHAGQDLRIVHRDVKPSNILIRHDGVVKLVDFGIARSQLDGGLKTEPGIAKGTPNFMSPEQVTAGELDGRSDLFAVGSVLYFGLTGRTLFTGTSLNEVLGRIAQVEDTLESLGTFAVVERLAPGLGPVLRRLFARSPADRYASAAEVVDKLEALRAEAPSAPTLAELGGILKARPGTGAAALMAPVPALPPKGALRSSGGTAIPVGPTRRQESWRPEEPTPAVPPTRPEVGRPRVGGGVVAPTQPLPRRAADGVTPTRAQLPRRLAGEGMTPTRPQVAWRVGDPSGPAEGEKSQPAAEGQPPVPAWRSNLGLVEGAEQLLAGLVGRVFDSAIVRSGRDGDRVDPGAIPRTVVRQLQRNIQPIGNERYCPHMVRLVVTPAVDELLGVLRMAVLQEVERAAEEWAQDEHVRFLQPIQVEWVLAESQRSHQVDVRVSYEVASASPPDSGPAINPAADVEGEQHDALVPDPVPESGVAIETRLPSATPWGRLVPKTGPSLPLSGTVIVGRRSPADLIIDDPSVTSRHARLYRDERGRCMVEDLESLNGTQVGGRRVVVLARLRHGDRVAFGTRVFRFEEAQHGVG